MICRKEVYVLLPYAWFTVAVRDVKGDHLVALVRRVSEVLECIVS
jgi:uncharacterized membrane protein YjjP (DUF1212 family)